MRVDKRAGPAILLSVALERTHAENVVNVMVRKHSGREPRIGPPAADGLVQQNGVDHRPGVEHHEAIAGVDGVGAGKALVEQHAGGNLLPIGDANHQWVVLSRIGNAIPELFGQFADVDHVVHLSG